MKNTALSLFFTLLGFTSLCAQVVNIPDANFKTALVNNPAINTNGDGEIQIAEAEAYTGAISVYDRGISDLTGIEAFVAITAINCHTNQLTNLDISANSALEELNCHTNQLTNLNISANLVLYYLDFRYNALTSLNLQNGINPNMSIYGFSDVQSESCIQVDDPDWAYMHWNAGNNLFFSINCSACPGIGDTDGDGVCADVDCDDLNPNITAVDADGDGFCPENQFVIIPNATFKSILVNNPAINTNGDGEIQVIEAEAYNGGMNFHSENISDFTGIEAFTAMEYLKLYDICINNCQGSFTSLALTSNPGLKYLEFSGNWELANLDLSGCTALEYLECEASRLSSLDLSNCPNLKYLICKENYGLESLDVSANAALVQLVCDDNNLTNLTLGAKPVLNYLSCEENSLESLDVSECPTLENLYCPYNQLGSLNVSANPAMVELVCWDNQLTSLDVTGNPVLEILDCSRNQLASLDVSSNPALKRLRCIFNQLAGLDISSNLVLESLSCRHNQLITLNLQNGNNLNMSIGALKNPGINCVQVDDPAWAYNNWLENIDLTGIFNTNHAAIFSTNCADGPVINILDAAFKSALLNTPEINTNGDEEIQLSEAEAYSAAIDVAGLDITDMTGIEAFTSINALDCSSNQLTILDVSGKPNLVYLDCSDNQIEALNVQNGNNHNFTYFDARTNASLNCIQVDDASWAVSNWASFVDPAVDFNVLCPYAQTVYIPDPAFKAALVNDPAINTNGDGEIQVAEAEAYGGAILVSGLDITDLTGIEDFTAIDSLDCSDNHLTSLDISANSGLSSLDCSWNWLSSLDVSSNSALKYLNSTENYPFGNLDLSGNPNLEYLLCGVNGLTSLDLSWNPNLVYLDCYDNPLTTLDISGNPALDYLKCASNLITSLDVSTNSALRWIDCQYSRLEHLDFSNNPNLIYANCDGNNLISLNAQNGNNINMQLRTEDNEPLRCIQVDDPEQAIEDWGFDTVNDAIYSTDCNVYIPDANFKAALVNNPAINVNGNEEIQIWEAFHFYGTIEVSSLNITSLMGIEAFENIDTLNCSGNQLSNLDISKNQQLVYLNSSSNQLTALNVGDLSNLRHLDCSGNQLINLDVSANSALVILDCGYNQIQHLDLSNNPDLSYLNCSGNQLTALDVSGNTELTRLDCSNNQLASLNVQNDKNMNIQSFDARENPGLGCIQVDHPAWSAAFWSYDVDSTAIFSTDCEAITGTSAATEAGFSIYPNPTTGELAIALGATYSNLIVEVKDVMGRTLSKKAYNTMDQLELQLDGPAGIYWVTVKAGDSRFVTVRVVKL